jgi:hypothetical protein
MCNGYIIFHGPTIGWPVWQAILSLQLDRLTWTKSLNGLSDALTTGMAGKYTTNIVHFLFSDAYYTIFTRDESGERAPGDSG